MIRPHVMVPVNESNGFFTRFLPLAAALQASTWKKVSRPSGNSPGGQKKKGSGNKNPGPSSPPAQSGRPAGKQQSGNPGAGAQGKAAEASKKPKPYANKLGADGKLKPEERERRKKLGLCMFCGGNHATDDCNKRPGQASGKAASAEPVSGQGDASGKDGKSPESKK